MHDIIWEKQKKSGKLSSCYQIISVDVYILKKCYMYELWYNILSVMVIYHFFCLIFELWRFWFFLQFFLILKEDVDKYDEIILSHKKRKMKNHWDLIKYFEWK